jgi:chorismate mutase
MKTIDSLRVELDLLDDTIMRSLNERFALMGAVAEAKKATGLQTTDPKREDAILEKTKHYNHASAIAEVYRTVFIVSKKLQKDASS